MKKNNERKRCFVGPAIDCQYEQAVREVVDMFVLHYLSSDSEFHEIGNEFRELRKMPPTEKSIELLKKLNLSLEVLFNNHKRRESSLINKRRLGPSLTNPTSNNSIILMDLSSDSETDFSVIDRNDTQAKKKFSDAKTQDCSPGVASNEFHATCSSHESVQDASSTNLQRSEAFTEENVRKPKIDGHKDEWKKKSDVASISAKRKRKSSAKSSQKLPTGPLRTFEKVLMNLGDEAYDSLTPIQLGYGWLLNHLNPENSVSEIDKVVQYILVKNIMVLHLNNMLASISSIERVRQIGICEKIPQVKLGRYSEMENNIIRENWEKLIMSVPIKEPSKCIKDFEILKISKGRLNLKKRNILGCFLGQGLTYKRFCVDVFMHTMTVILNDRIEGRYSKQEDALILQEVKKNGTNSTTWNRLALLLNRSSSSGIRARYHCLMIGSSGRKHKWTISEDWVLLESLFKGKKNHSLDDINSVSMKSLKPIAAMLERKCLQVYDRWNMFLAPTIKSYILGVLHTPWVKSFLKYLISKKVSAIQDIDWREACKLFPGQTTRSMVSKVNSNVMHYKKHYPSLTFYQLLLKILKESVSMFNTEKSKAFREKIVQIYDEVINS